jgi:hypothetical protein
VPFPEKATPPPLSKKVSNPSPSRSKKAGVGPPASESQLRCLAAHGKLEDQDYTKRQASGLISAIKRSKEKPNYELADQSRKLIWKIETRSTKKEITRLGKKLAKAGISEEDASYLKEDLEIYKDRLTEIAEEKEDWKEDEKAEREDAKERISEFQEELGPYGEWTEYIKKPTQAQIKQCLEALDEHHPDWELASGAEPLVATLISSFPVLKKKGSPIKKSGGSGESTGCLVLITAIVLVIYCMGSAVA